MAGVLVGGWAMVACLAAAATAQPAGASGPQGPAPAETAPDKAGGQRGSGEKLAPLELANWIDARFEERLKLQKLTPADLVDDATFLRRAYLDLVGTIPSVSQTRDFLADKNTFKREDLVDRLLADRRSAEHLARTWRRVLVPGSAPNAMYATQMEPWLVEQFSANVPYDDLARSLVTATGAPGGGSPTAFYQAIGNRPENLANAFSRIFLGVRLGCAQCHDHPFADWKQEDFWGLAAFFAGMNAAQPDGSVAESRLAKIKPEDSDREYVARFLWDGEAKIPDDKLPRQVLAEWLASPKNPNFAATAVNRVWQHLCGRGMAGSVDDLDQVDPDQRVMLDELAAKFADAEFDLRWLIQGISKSKVYQRPSETIAAGEARSLARRSLKTLTPEQVFDSLEQALALPVSRSDSSPRHNGQREQLVLRLNEAFDDSPEQFRAGIPQTLIMMNGQLVSKATDLEQSRTLRAVVDAPFLSPPAKIEALYLAAFTRKPRPEELDTMLELVKSQPDAEEQRQVYAEIFWAILNSPEFVLSR
jgi:hypothetical protein